MSVNLTLTSDNCSLDASGRWHYIFPGQALRLRGNPTIACERLHIKQSIANVSAPYANQSFQLVDQSTAGAPRIINCTLPAGIYDATALQSAIIQFCTSAGLYYVAGGTPVYLLTLLWSPTQGRILLTVTPPPTSYSGTTTNPNGLGGSGVGPLLVLPAAFGALIGFPAGSYGPSVAGQNYALFGPNAPQSPVRQLDVCFDSCVNDNPLFSRVPSSIQTVRLSFVDEFGSDIDVEPTRLTPRRCIEADYSELVLSFRDQGNNIVVFQQPSFVLSIVINL